MGTSGIWKGYTMLTLAQKQQFRTTMHTMDRVCEPLTGTWQREALRAAWFLCDALVRDDPGGVWLAETILQQRKEGR